MFIWSYLLYLCIICSSSLDDKTRVPVGENEGYINASYIRMKVGTEELFYISAQGPLPGTQDNFWQMVWENKSDVIAMMTQEVERGRVKCHKYWPEKLDMLGYFHIKVIKMVEKEVRNVHFVKHLKFTTWPDHGTPHSSEQLVRFIRYMRAVHAKGPIIVHCSAGIGRAGVLICTDVILSLIEKDLSVSILNKYSINTKIKAIVHPKVKIFVHLNIRSDRILFKYIA
uniref:Protein tyrosine phosphatase non-receptor type 20 n=1 Tax=Cyprinus carpio TaxID=7962 RepID=A0A8C2FIS6_CYPCA